MTCPVKTVTICTDSLGAPAANKHKEDEVFSTASTAARVKLTNYVQIFMKGYFVTEAQEAVLKAGVDSEIRYQMAKAMKEIARDVEYAYLNNSTNNAGDATTAPQMGGLKYFNTTNAVAMGSTPFSEDSLNDAIQLAWADGGSPKTVILSGANKRIASGFTAGSMKTRDVGSKKLVNVVDVFVCVAA